MEDSIAIADVSNGGQLARFVTQARKEAIPVYVTPNVARLLTLIHYHFEHPMSLMLIKHTKCMVRTVNIDAPLSHVDVYVLF